LLDVVKKFNGTTKSGFFILVSLALTKEIELDILEKGFLDPTNNC